MKNTSKKLMTLLLTAGIVTLVGCSSTNTTEENTVAGGATGAVLGGLAGSLIGQGTGKLLAVGAGAIAGALIGGTIGENMDSSDKARCYRAMDNNPTNTSTHWVNPQTKHQYTVAPTSATFASNGYSTCRRYYSTAVINGEKQKVSGVACRQADGSWQTISG